MDRIDKAQMRVVAVIVLLIVTAAALHGYRPDRRAPASGPPVRSFDTLSTVVAMLIVSIVIIAITITTRSRRRSAAPRIDIPARKTTGERSALLEQAIALAFTEIGDVSREPRAAIIAGYLALERELAGVPDAIPRDADTPWEVLSRAVERPGGSPAHSAIRLVELFEEARFSPHAMTEAHRDDAVRALGQVLASLQVSSCGR